MIPAFINTEAGSAQQAIEHIRHDSRFEIEQVTAAEMAGAVREAIRNDVSRILACGGDGTLALIAGQIIGTSTELAIFPGGTLNHFAGRIGLPADPERILDIAVSCPSSPVDVGCANDHIFLNTSSIGAYVHFVRTRNYLENRMSYAVASLFAGLRRLLRMRFVHINIDGSPIRTPLVFIGVGEREISFPFLGKEKLNGQHGLHLIAIKDASTLATAGLAFNAMLRGIEPLRKERDVESRIVVSTEMNYAKSRRKQITVALDGEIHLLKPPICYEFRPAALNVVCGCN